MYIVDRSILAMYLKKAVKNRFSHKWYRPSNYISAYITLQYTQITLATWWWSLMMLVSPVLYAKSRFRIDWDVFYGSVHASLNVQVEHAIDEWLELQSAWTRCWTKHWISAFASDHWSGRWAAGTAGITQTRSIRCVMVEQALAWKWLDKNWITLVIGHSFVIF